MSAVAHRSLVRFSGSLDALTRVERTALLERGTTNDDEIRERTRLVIADVRERGDAALRAMAQQFDGVTLSDIQVNRDLCERALTRLEPDLRRAMERSARNIRRVHTAFLPVTQEVESEPGVVIGRRPDALARVGVYAPGGRAAYPSSLLMGAIPARVAGVREVIVCSPPSAATGLPSDVVLAAAALAEVDSVFAIGGAGAIAALAFGTTSVPRVDRIVGPGNAYVAEAKLQVASAVGIDSPAGPSELLVLSDASADPSIIARELLAQAEHDPRAACVALTTSAEHAQKIIDAIALLLPTQPRRAIVEEALCGQGAVLWTRDRAAAIALANEYAAEHVLLLMDPLDQTLAHLRSVGTVFVGASSSVAFGDYITGANHVLPTGGVARSYSGLSTLDFIRWTTYQRVSPDAAARLADDVSVFATAERLEGHALAARAWSTERKP